MIADMKLEGRKMSTFRSADPLKINVLRF